jgi:3,8-divinyl chlorophyllide a/chlorophyllide a reductase subunit Z
VEPTPSRLAQPLPWDDDARQRLQDLIDAEPVLVRISAAKRMRDAAESDARHRGEEHVTTAGLARLFGGRKVGVTA